MSRLIVVNGPTASGKTSFAIALAQYFNTEILSSDSRQFFKEIPIGTAQPNADELAAAKHHFIASHSVTQNLSAGEYERLALSKLDTLFSSYNNVIMVGGSGMYEKAVCEGLDDLPHSPEMRDQLMLELNENGLALLQAELKEKDPEHYARMDVQNPQRVVRALEVCRISPIPYSQLRKQQQKTRPFDVIKFGMDLPRVELYHRINQRVELMVENGLVDEVKKVLPYRHKNALKTVGYKELFAYLDGHCSLLEAMAAVQQNTRRFAKRQMTWYRRDKTIQWLHPREGIETALKKLNVR